MSSQGALKQDEGERWTGNGWSHWSHVLKPREDSSFVQDVDGVALRSGRARGGGGDGAGHFGEHVSSLTLSTGSWTDFGADSTLFSPSDSFSPSSQQLLQQSSSLYWQNLLGGQPNSRWLTRWPSPRFATFGGEPGTEQAGSLDTFSLAGHEVKRSDDVQLDVAVAYEINATNGVLSGIEVDRSPEVEIERNSNVNLERDNWKTLGDSMFGNVKQEEFWNTKETGHLLEDDIKSQIRLSRNPEEVINFEPSPTSSDSNPDSEESNKRKKQFSNRKRKRPGQDADGNVTWTDESVTLLFETNDTIHRRLCTESKGQVKYEKKWIPILRAMQARIMSVKAAATDPSWNPSIAGRELLKPKFYDVWLAVSGQYQSAVAKPNKSSAKGDEGSRELRKSELSHFHSKNGYSMKQDSGTAIKMMYRLMLDQIQASEIREEAMKYRAERMMECLTEHMEHVETRVGILDAGRDSQQLLERVNLKLEKVLDGFVTLNQNLSLLY